MQDGRAGNGPALQQECTTARAQLVPRLGPTPTPGNMHTAAAFLRGNHIWAYARLHGQASSLFQQRQSLQGLLRLAWPCSHTDARKTYNSTRLNNLPAPPLRPLQSRQETCYYKRASAHGEAVGRSQVAVDSRTTRSHMRPGRQRHIVSSPSQGISSPHPGLLAGVTYGPCTAASRPFACNARCTAASRPLLVLLLILPGVLKGVEDDGSGVLLTLVCDPALHRQGVYGGNVGYR